MNESDRKEAELLVAAYKQKDGFDRIDAALACLLLCKLAAQPAQVPMDETSRKLAEVVLSLGLTTDAGLHAKTLAREVLSICDFGQGQQFTTITTNGTTRVIPKDEPVFLIRGQDVVGGAAVRGWATLAKIAGASHEIVDMALEHAEKMEAWPKKKVPDATKSKHTTG